ncbi:MAG: DUF4232 domain-containing protein [Thermoleophilia bacterium]|jgi:hypothetical protein|nr:DUF4232 domain-containing protein [Thermoleophilia bacterium]
MTRRLVPAALAAGAAAMLVLAPSAQAATPRCEVGRLAVTLGPAQAGAGNQEQVYVLTNVSGRTCQLRGYPGMGFLAADGRLLRGTVTRGSTTLFRDPGPRTLLVRPGGRVSYSLGYVTPQTRACPVTAEVEVTPPNAVSTIFVRSRIPVCAGQPMVVSAVVPGTRGA